MKSSITQTEPPADLKQAPAPPSQVFELLLMPALLGLQLRKPRQAVTARSA